MAGKRAHGEGTISQRKTDGRWIGQITVSIEDGKQVRKAVSDKSQQGCKKKLDALKLQFSTNTYVPPKKTTYIEYLKTWLEQKANLEKLKPSTIETHRGRIKLYIEPYFKKVELQKITIPMLNSFYTVLASKISAHTVHKVHAIINNSMRFAVRDGFININPATNALLPKFITKPKESLPPEDITKLLQTAKEYQAKPTTITKNVFPLISLAINTGMRRGELAALRWADIDLESHIINIKHSIMEINGRCFLDTPKTESSLRTIYISPAMTEILRGHQQVANGEYVFPATTNPNKPMIPSNISRFFYTVMKKAELKGGIHITRHSHITQLAENGVNIKTIQDRAGHSQVSTTLGYCHPSKEKDMEAAAIFDQFIK